MKNGHRNPRLKDGHSRIYTSLFCKVFSFLWPNQVRKQRCPETGLLAYSVINATLFSRAMEKNDLTLWGAVKRRALFVCTYGTCSARRGALCLFSGVASVIECIIQLLQWQKRSSWIKCNVKLGVVKTLIVHKFFPIRLANLLNALH